MEKNIPIHLREIIFSSSDASTSRQISQLLKEGKIKKLAPRLYTGKIDEDPGVLIRRNVFEIVGKLYDGAVLSHRSALEYKPTESGSLFLTYLYTRKIEYPGIILNFLAGKPAIEGDPRFFNLFVSQPARAYLENFQVSRKPGPNSKTLTVAELEERLEKIIQTRGEEAINELRDRAREIAGDLEMQTEFRKLNQVISSLLKATTI